MMMLWKACVMITLLVMKPGLCQTGERTLCSFHILMLAHNNSNSNNIKIIHIKSHNNYNKNSINNHKTAVTPAFAASTPRYLSPKLTYKTTDSAAGFLSQLSCKFISGTGGCGQPLSPCRFKQLCQQRWVLCAQSCLHVCFKGFRSKNPAGPTTWEPLTQFRFFTTFLPGYSSKVDSRRMLWTDEFKDLVVVLYFL